MHRLSLFVVLALLLCVRAPGVVAQTLSEPVDEEAVALIRAHGLDASQLPELLQPMTDVFGGRLTGSLELDRASEWAAEQMREMGLENVSLEAWGPFGRGWTLNKFSLHARGDEVSFPLHGFPKAWSAGIDGEISVPVVVVKAETPEAITDNLDAYKGKAVLISTPRDLNEPFDPIAVRHDEESLLSMANWAGSSGGGGRNYSPEMIERFRRQRAISSAIFQAEPAVILDQSRSGNYGTIFVSSASVPAPPSAGFMGGPRAWHADAPTVIPQFTLAPEHYNRLHRLVDGGYAVNLEAALDISYFDDDPMEYNVVGEIVGTDPEIGDEIVMVGGHYDGWHAGTGTTDNAAGSAVSMEALRILKEVYAELGRQPRRTIRVALWTGEEQGLLGSRAYVSQNFAESARRGGGITQVHPDHEKLSGYFNFDNGTGKIRGVYLQGNEGVAPIFRAWLKPFHDLGAATLTLQNTGGTDHLAFDGVGLPGFQFIQEPIAYSSETHHSDMDVYDHAILDDLKQAATIMASFAYHAAERDQMLPRKPMPSPPGTSSR